MFVGDSEQQKWQLVSKIYSNPTILSELKEKPVRSCTGFADTINTIAAVGVHSALESGDIFFQQ